MILRPHCLQNNRTALTRSRAFEGIPASSSIQATLAPATPLSPAPGGTRAAKIERLQAPKRGPTAESQDGPEIRVTDAAGMPGSRTERLQEACLPIGVLPADQDDKACASGGAGEGMAIWERLGARQRERVAGAGRNRLPRALEADGHGNSGGGS